MRSLRLRSILRQRRTASAFSRFFFTDGFSKSRRSFISRKIPFAICFGNHDRQVGVSNSEQFEIYKSFDYFIGLAENAISYLTYTKKETPKTIYDNKVLSHNNLYHSLEDPLNIIIDHKSRDLAEYIKISFFNNNKNIFQELDNYFYYQKYSDYGIRVLFSRILYPSFYFKIYNDIIQGIIKEKELNKIINNIDKYEIYIYKIYIYLKKYSNLPPVEWLKKTKN